MKPKILTYYRRKGNISSTESAKTISLENLTSGPQTMVTLAVRHEINIEI